MTDTDDDTDIWGESTDDDFTPNNPFAHLNAPEADDDDTDPVVEEPEADADEDVDPDPDADVDPDADPEEEEQADPDLLPEPILVGNVWCTTVSQLTKVALTAQEQVDKTSRTDREPVNQNPLAGLGGDSGDAWELAYQAMEPKTQAQLQAMWESDPESVAKGAWTDYNILGPELSQHLYDLWKTANPYDAIKFELEMGALSVQGQTAEVDPVLQQMATDRVTDEAETLLVNSVEGWTPAISQFVGTFIAENAEQLGLENAGSSPDEMAQFVASIYYWLKGQDALPVEQTEEEQTEVETKRTTTKKRAHTPVKSSAPPIPSGNEDLDWDDEPGFQLPKIPTKK